MSAAIAQHPDHGCSRMSKGRHNAAQLYVDSLPSPASRRTARQSLSRVAHLLSQGRHTLLSYPWHRLTSHDLQRLRAHLLETVSASTTNVRLAFLRGVLRQLWRSGGLSHEQLERLTDWKRVPGQPVRRGRERTRRDLERVREAARQQQPPRSLRDEALLGVLWATGLRRGELVSLRLADYAGESGRLAVVCGKGNKPRAVYVTGWAREALDGWLALLPRDGGPMFRPIDRAGRITNGALQPESVREITRRLGALAGLEDLNPHDFRRTFITRGLDQGADLLLIGKAVGHDNADTTGIYDLRQEEALRRVFEGMTR